MEKKLPLFSIGLYCVRVTIASCNTKAAESPQERWKWLGDKTDKSVSTVLNSGVSRGKTVGTGTQGGGSQSCVHARQVSTFLHRVTLLQVLQSLLLTRIQHRLSSHRMWNKIVEQHNEWVCILEVISVINLDVNHCRSSLIPRLPSPMQWQKPRRVCTFAHNSVVQMSWYINYVSFDMFVLIGHICVHPAMVCPTSDKLLTSLTCRLRSSYIQLLRVSEAWD